ncbi:MAG: hypothetical protein JRI23_00670 [Deltaproteobacteria bacterium]|jgi:hypothetical protein|nr:hypothetical protein [Deltaproteobacteria bacterium]MBW2529963.1 hypothetical protein [Deltaproteobacteria bacterium]
MWHGTNEGFAWGAAGLLLMLSCAGCSDEESPSSTSSPTGTTSSGTPTGTSTGGSGGAGGTGGTGGTGGEAGPPGYTPFSLADCDDGTIGQDAVGPDALAGVIGAGVEYSDEQAVDGVGQSCKSFGFAGQNFFGGTFRTDGMDVGAGDDLWMRQALYFPAGFCFGYGTTSGDGWGATKWLRIEFDNGGSGGSPGDRLTLQLGNFAAQACNSEGRLWGATREYISAYNFRPADQDTPITTGQWHFIQWHVHLTTDGAAFIRFWLDEVFLGQVDEVTLSDAANRIDFIRYGDYWNGSPYQDVVWYMDEVIISSEQPDTVDAGGRPYIAPAARVADWD